MSEFASEPNINEEIGRTVNSQHKVAGIDDIFNKGSRFAILIFLIILRTPNDFVEIGNDFETLAKYENKDDD